jgi:tetratricopeptide (TPR) repeat protein
MDTRTLLRERLRRSRDWAQAIDELEKELEQAESKPEQSELLFELASLTEDIIPERDRALGLYQRAWKLHPDNLKALTRAREVYGELGRHEMVAKLGEMELRSPAAPIDLAAIVGEALLDSGQRDKARPFLERALERTPDSLRVKDAVAATEYDAEFWEDEVDRLLGEADRMGKAGDQQASARFLVRAARILRAQQGESEMLEGVLNRILEKNLDEPSANFMYEALLATAQRWDDLEKLHERRAVSGPDDAARAARYRDFGLEWVQRFKDRERGARFFGRALHTLTANGKSPNAMRSVVAAFALLLQVQGERGEWKPLIYPPVRVLEPVSA